MIKSVAPSVAAVVVSSAWAALVAADELNRAPNPWICPVESTAVKVVSFVLTTVVWQTVTKIAANRITALWIKASTERFENQMNAMSQRFESQILNRMARRG